ncbi:FAD-dependent oxidoreductase [Nocardioides marmoraquaticus]
MTRTVVVGSGMAATRLVEQLVARGVTDVTVLGDEEHPAYNRILLSAVVEGTHRVEAITLREPGWYAAHGVELRRGARVLDVDRAAREVMLVDGERIGYDRLVLATGSVPSLPPIRGLVRMDGTLHPAVHPFRSLTDCHRLDAAVRALVSAPPLVEPVETTATPPLPEARAQRATNGMTPPLPEVRAQRATNGMTPPLPEVRAQRATKGGPFVTPARPSRAPQGPEWATDENPLVEPVETTATPPLPEVRAQRATKGGPFVTPARPSRAPQGPESAPARPSRAPQGPEWATDENPLVEPVETTAAPPLPEERAQRATKGGPFVTPARPSRAPQGPESAPARPSRAPQGADSTDATPRADHADATPGAGRAPRAVVVGGGLLGLQVARALAVRGVDVELVEGGEHLLNSQVGTRAGGIIARDLARLGTAVYTGARVVRLSGTDEAPVLRLDNGYDLDTDLVVLTAGGRPSTALAKRAGLRVRRGVVVDDHLTTSDPHVHAIGDCAEHAGRTTGFVAPAWEQAEALAAHLAGEGASYAGTRSVARLRATGLDVAVLGDPLTAEGEVVEVTNPVTRSHRRLVVREGVVVAAELVGDLSRVGLITQHHDRGTVLGPEEPAALLLPDRPATGAAASAAALPDDAEVCACAGVPAGAVRACSSLDAVRETTRATTGCGGCAPVVRQLLATRSPQPVR